MKRKFSLMWRVAITLVMVVTLGLVTVTPAAASPDLTEVSITVNPPTGSATAEYIVDFFVHTGLTDEVNAFVIEFPAGTTVPATIATADVEIYDMTVPTGPQVPSDVVVVGQVVYVYMPTIGPGIAAFHYGRVVFKLDAGIKNPAATGVQTFSAWVYSDEEPTPVPADYEIYEMVPIDVYLKYKIPPEDCADVVDILVDTFVSIGNALDFVDDLYTSGATAIFVLKGAVYNTTTPGYGTMTTGTWAIAGSVTQAIGDQLKVTDITWAETETFAVIYNSNDGTQTTVNVPITSATGFTTVLTGVVDVVNVVGADAGATPGFQNTFKLSGDSYNTAAGAYGDFGVTAAGTFTDGTSIGEALTVDVTTNPTTNPETYTVTYTRDDATGAGTHIASLTVLTDGTKIWSPAAPTNVVDVTTVASEAPAWEWWAVGPTPAGLVGARVLVDDGNYMETITIDTPGVMVESVNGAASTIIDATGLTPAGPLQTHHIAAVMITAEGVTFGGTGKGFTVKNAGVGVDAGGIGTFATIYADENSDGIADVSGVYIWPNGGTHPPQAGTTHWSRVNIIDNIIYGSQGCGIRADAGDGTFTLGGVSVYVGENTVYDNLFDGFHGDNLTSGPTWLDPGYTFVASGVTFGYTAIVDNEFYQNGGSGMGNWEINGEFTTTGDWRDSGILIGSTIVFSGYSPLGTVYIVGNDIHDNVHAGINLLTGAAVDALVIEENAIYDNGVFGIYTKIASGDQSNVTCRYNDIYGNTHWGIKNIVAGNFTAKENYWGELGGPSRGPAPVRHEEDQRSDALGNGDAVSHYVYYNPWLSVSFVTVLDDGIRYYGSDTLTLQTGWNTLSVPLALYDPADTIGEIAGLGDFLISSGTDMNWEVAYQYNPATGLWENIGQSAIGLDPSRGYYIKILAATRFPVLYSSALGLPAFALDAGWNLIGSGFGIDRDSAEGQGRWAVADPGDADTEAAMEVGDALSSISGQVSVVVSPSVPGQIAIWSLVYDSAAATLMYTGEGYWVFMTADGTLAGFEITPLYLP